MKRILAVIGIACILPVSVAFSAETTMAADAAATSATPADVPAIQGPDAELVKGAVMEYIAKDTELKGGIFLLNDLGEKKGKVLSLKDPVPGAYVAQSTDSAVLCVEMSSGKGKTKKVYEVDFSVVKDASGKLGVVSMKVRKVGKKERFIYGADGKEAPVPKPAKKAKKKAKKAAAPASGM